MAVTHDDDLLLEERARHGRAVDRPAWPDDDRRRDAVPERVVVRKNSIGTTLRVMLGTVLLVAIVAFAAVNTQRVQVDAVFDTFSTGLSAAIGAASAAGFLVGFLFAYRRCRREHV